MSEVINACVTGLNGVGRGFCEYAVGMFLQSGVLIAVLFLVDFLLRQRIRATLRYWIWMLAFVKLVLPPGFSIPTGIGYWCGPCVSPAPMVSQPAIETVPTDAMPVLVPADTPPVMPPEQPSYPVPAGLSPAGPVAVASESLTWQAGVFLLWVAGVLAFAGLVIQRLLFVRVLMAQGEPAQDDLLDTLDQCRRRIGVRREVDLKLSPNTFSPAVCGLFRRTILIPAGFLGRMSPENLRAVLIHELAHVRRGDLWVNSLQTVLQVVYFYNPLVWLANAIVRRVREQAVDEMVLVALGAEARSYSRTLIDIAEMAFLRVSPALRLIGVVESRKSLEGRIRHMVTRPMPKSARVGIVGVFVVAATGAILLPMARATIEPPPRFVANLPGGATVELVGVCNWPASGPISWRADGSTLDKPLYARKWNVRPGANDYGFLFRVAGTDDIDLLWNRIEGSEGSEGSCDVVDDQGNRLEGGNAAVASIKPSTVRTTLRVALPTGPWNTISSHDGKRMSSGRGSGVLWSQAFGDSSGTRIVASAERQREQKHRIAAIDTEGAVHIAPVGGSVSAGNVLQFTAHFPDLGLDRIKEFQYQTRDGQMIEFRNISLRPGEKTDVQVEVEGPTAVSGGNAGSQSSGPPGAPDARANIFVISSPTGFNVFNAVIARADDWAWNRTGRNHAKEAYDQIFDGTNNRTDHDVLVLLFSLDREDRIPGGYEDLLPKPWSQIEEQLRQGRTVELSGRARGLNVILLAAPKAEQLEKAIADSELLVNPQGMLGRSGNGCDIAIQSFKVQRDPDRGTFRASTSIRNIGRAASPRFIVRYYAGDPPAVRPMIQGAGPLRPNELFHVGSSDFGLKEGVSEVYVVVDPADLVDELDETNNRATLRVVVKDGEIVEQSPIPVAARQTESGDIFRSYLVNRSVADFPPGEDFSTPEAAYATINRMDQRDSSAWQKVSVARLADRLGRDGSDRKSTADPAWAKVLANARIHEVMVWNMTRAAVIAELPQELSGKEIVDPFDVRFLQLENGRWLNTGNGRFPSIQAAKAHFMGWMERETTSAEAMRDPLRHADEIKQAARQIFERLRTADYARIQSYFRDGKWQRDGWKEFPTWGVYTVYTDYPSFALWCCTHFKDNPIVDVQLGDVFLGDALVLDKTGWPTVPYKLTLKDGTVLAGNLPFRYLTDEGKGHWHGMEGIDWHLWPNGTRSQP